MDFRAKVPALKMAGEAYRPSLKACKTCKEAKKIKYYFPITKDYGESSPLLAFPSGSIGATEVVRLEVRKSPMQPSDPDHGSI